MSIIPIGYCQCGCGQRSPIATQTNKRYGYIKGQPVRYISGHNSRGATNPAYNYGLWFNNKQGRWYIHCRDGKKVLYSRAVMESHLKRRLLPSEIVHHINDNPADDRLENLKLTTKAEHNYHHHHSDFEYSEQALLDGLVKLSHELGRIPRAVDVEQASWLPSSMTYLRRFGGFRVALRKAGVVA